MGMSSSQARLLTLTGRMHSIEQRAQRIQAEKLRLANESDKVYDDYLLALDETKLVAKVLSENGTTTDIPFTAGLVYTYNGLMGQYALKSKNDKTLIPENISNNYKSTNTLSDFLEKFGITTTTTLDRNPEYEKQLEKYQQDLKEWQDWKADHDAWLRERDAYNIAHTAWENQDPNIETIKNDTNQSWWVTQTYNLGEDFKEAASKGGSSSSCYHSAINSGSVGCYRHILSSIIDFNGGSVSTSTYTTTTGSNTTLIASRGYCSNSYTLANGKTNTNVYIEVSDALNNGIIPDATGETCDVTNSSTEYEKLVSKWNTNGTLKTMKQWAIDLNYIATETTSVSGYPSNAIFGASIATFQAALENALSKEMDQQLFDEAVTEWRTDEPTLREEPKLDGSTSPTAPVQGDYTDGIAETIPREQIGGAGGAGSIDTELAQYYINLWYKMEGSDEPQEIFDKTTYDGAGNPIVSYSFYNENKSATTFTTNAKTGAEENENYIIIPTDKLEDPTWLKNSILEGYVIIQQFDKLEGKFSDTSVSITTKIHEVPDETNLKKAEAQYEADMKRINAKDARYDRELAIVDNERNAIKEEIETLKTVAKDNVDRSFKLFS